MFGDGIRADPVFAEVVARVEQNIAESIADLIAIDDLGPSDRKMLASGIVGLAEGAVRGHASRDQRPVTHSDPGRGTGLGRSKRNLSAKTSTRRNIDRFGG